jgi:hypothetical protein
MAELAKLIVEEAVCRSNNLAKKTALIRICHEFFDFHTFDHGCPFTFIEYSGT